MSDGIKKKAEKRRKREQVCVRFTSEFYDVLDAVAKSKSITLATYLRNLAYRDCKTIDGVDLSGVKVPERRKKIDAPDLVALNALRGDMRKVGGVLIQFAKAINEKTPDRSNDNNTGIVDNFCDKTNMVFPITHYDICDSYNNLKAAISEIDQLARTIQEKL